MVFSGPLKLRAQQAGEYFIDFLRESQQLTQKMFPDEHQDIRDHIVVRGFLEEINHSQVRLEHRKIIKDNDMNITKTIERALQLKDVIRIEEGRTTNVTNSSHTEV